MSGASAHSRHHPDRALQRFSAHVLGVQHLLRLDQFLSRPRAGWPVGRRSGCRTGDNRACSGAGIGLRDREVQDIRDFETPLRTASKRSRIQDGSAMMLIATVRPSEHISASRNWHAAIRACTSRNSPGWSWPRWRSSRIRWTRRGYALPDISKKLLVLREERVSRVRREKLHLKITTDKRRYVLSMPALQSSATVRTFRSFALVVRLF